MSAGEKECWNQWSEAALAVGQTTSVGETSNRADHNQWLAIVSETGEVTAALHAVTLAGYDPRLPISSILPRLPAMIRVSAEVTPASLIDSWMLDELQPESAIIVVGSDSVHVVSWPFLQEKLENVDPVRGVYGNPAIRELIKFCKFECATNVCGHQESFAAKPKEMPICPDPTKLGIHPFAW
ncbi:cupin domain-containing protein [Streptomyces europaeiscabiei]|uniref:hypothetical protein n=1 Tax=Streptomyces europaeiscabiei TaxID=146819 RepID=UPI0038F80A7D